MRGRSSGGSFRASGNCGPRDSNCSHKRASWWPGWLNSGGDFKSIVKSIPNLRFWFSAPLEVGYADGDIVPTPLDQSGNGVVITAPGGRAPKYRTNVINGQPVFRFNGTLDLYRGVKTDFDFLHKDSNTLIWLIKQTAGGSQYLFDNVGGMSPMGIGRVIRILPAGQNWVEVCYAAGSPNDVFAIQTDNGTFPTGNFNIAVGRYDKNKVGDDFECFINNNNPVVDQGTLGPSALTSTQLPTIGSTAATGGYFNGDIAEIIAFDRALTNEEINVIVGGLNFGI